MKKYHTGQGGRREPLSVYANRTHAELEAIWTLIDRKKELRRIEKIKHNKELSEHILDGKELG